MKQKKWLIFSSLVFVTALLASIGVGHALANYPEAHFVSLVDLSREVEAETFDELVESLRSDAVDFLGNEITWSSADGELTTSPAQMGIYVDFDQVEAELEDFMERPEWERAWIFLAGKEISLPLTFDDSKMQAAFEGSGQEYAATNATYGMVDGAFNVIAHEEGYAIDWAAMQTELAQAWSTEWSSNMDLPRTVLEADVLASDLESHVDQAEELASNSLILQDEYGEEWGLELIDHVDWFEPLGDELTLNKEAFMDHAMLEWGEEVADEVQPVTITTDEDGNYVFEGSARFGKTLNAAQLYDLVLAELAKEERETILLPLDLEAPTINATEELAAMGVTDLVGYGYSNFSGSPYNRIHNIGVGMDIFNGTLLAPGEEFSFTTLMGPIDAAHGWKPELVIKGDETKPEYGGGLCQVSSTMFRAALYSGLPITDRKNHSYAVSYYAYPSGYGLDATIYDPAPDFRFTNDTDSHLLIQGYTEGYTAYFVFYGNYDGRRVKMEGPVNYGYYSISEPQTTYTDELAPGVRVLDEYAHTGFKTDWWRTIYYADGTESDRENFHSNYEARPTKYLEGKTEEESSEVGG